ncbi:MAG: GNAT family N-acetyltransferase [Acidimicrobiales bacterium]
MSALDKTVLIPTTTVTLRQVDEAVARGIVSRVRPSAGWAEDFPASGDLAAMRLWSFSSEPNVPWFGSYLTVVDDAASGTIGFKGAPTANQVEIGYGVVPWRQGRAVATEALSQLLILIAGLSLVVRAETHA